MRVKKNHFAGGANLTGEGTTGLAGLLNAKVDASDFAGMTALANGADLPTTVAKVNAIITALKLNA